MFPEVLPSPLAFLWRALSRHKVLVLLFFTVVMATTAVITYLMPRSFRSAAKLMVKLGREDVVLDPTVGIGQSAITMPTSRENEINSIIDLLSSRFLVEKVVDSIGPAAILGTGPARPYEEKGGKGEEAPLQLTMDDRYSAIALLSKKLEVELVKKSNTVSIKYEGPSPAIAQDVVKRLLDFYLVRHTQVHRTPGAAKFMSEQTSRLRQQLEQTEEALRDAKNQTGLFALEGQRLGLITLINKLEEDRALTLAAKVATEAETNALSDRLKNLPATHVTAATKGFPSQSADMIRAELFKLQVEEQKLLQRHPPGHPDVVAIRKQVASAKEINDSEDRAREQVTTGPNKLYEEAQTLLHKQEAQLAYLSARADSIQKQLILARQQFKQFTADEVSIVRLQRELELHTTNYKKYSDSNFQAQIERTLEEQRISNISIVQPATFDIKPVRPNVTVNMGLGLAFALAGGVGLALLLEHGAARRSRRPDERGEGPPTLVQGGNGLATMRP